MENIYKIKIEFNSGVDIYDAVKSSLNVLKKINEEETDNAISKTIVSFKFNETKIEVTDNSTEQLLKMYWDKNGL